jgi:Flp pilus assembly pilin Flp
MINLLKELFMVLRVGKRQEKGQTLIEYALIIALIVVVVIAVMGPLGDQIAAIFTDITGHLTPPAVPQ